MKVISIKLDEREIKHIEQLAREEKKDKSTVARELINYGCTYLFLKLYEESKISLERLSKRLELTISETLDLLSEFGIKSPIDYEDYLEGYETLQRL
jgi:predicted HTH domain antitoxin